MRASLLHLQRARHPLRAEQRLALALLANVPRGVTQDLLLLAHGFDSDLIAELVHAGHARSRREIVEAGGPPIEIVRITITDAGRQAIESERRPSLRSEGIIIGPCSLRDSRQRTMSDKLRRP